MDTSVPINEILAIILQSPLAHQPGAVPFRAVLRDLELNISSPLVGFAALCKSRYAPPWPMIKPWAVHGPLEETGWHPGNHTVTDAEWKAMAPSQKHHWRQKKKKHYATK